MSTTATPQNWGPLPTEPPKPAGIRVAEVSVTPTPNRATGNVIAYAWVRIEDGAGRGFYIRDLRLLRGRGGDVVLSMPTKPPKRKCTAGGTCHGDNLNAAKFCNWCGQPQTAYNPDDEPARFVDMIAPTNAATRSLIRDAIVAEYSRLAVESKSGPEPKST